MLCVDKPDYHFCTLFDSQFLLRGLTLFRSLARYLQDFHFYVLCLDEGSYHALKRLQQPHIIPLTLSDIEVWDPRLLKAKANRSLIEYYFTLSPALPLYLLRNFDGIEVITYLDADLFFYQSPAPLFAELGQASILVIEHRFPAHLQDKLQYGRFNVQYQSFRNNIQGWSVLNTGINNAWSGVMTAWKHSDLPTRNTWTVGPNGMMIW